MPAARAVPRALLMGALSGMAPRGAGWRDVSHDPHHSCVTAPTVGTPLLCVHTLRKCSRKSRRPREKVGPSDQTAAATQRVTDGYRQDSWERAHARVAEVSHDVDETSLPTDGRVLLSGHDRWSSASGPRRPARTCLRCTDTASPVRTRTAATRRTAAPDAPQPSKEMSREARRPRTDPRPRPHARPGPPALPRRHHHPRRHRRPRRRPPGHGRLGRPRRQRRQRRPRPAEQARDHPVHGPRRGRPRPPAQRPALRLPRGAPGAVRDRLPPDRVRRADPEHQRRGRPRHGHARDGPPAALLARRVRPGGRGQPRHRPDRAQRHRPSRPSAGRARSPRSSGCSTSGPATTRWSPAAARRRPTRRPGTWPSTGGTPWARSPWTSSASSCTRTTTTRATSSCSTAGRWTPSATPPGPRASGGSSTSWPTPTRTTSSSRWTSSGRTSRSTGTRSYTAPDGTVVQDRFDPLATVNAQRNDRFPLFHAKDGISQPGTTNGWAFTSFGDGDIDYQAFFDGVVGPRLPQPDVGAGQRPAANARRPRPGSRCSSPCPATRTCRHCGADSSSPPPRGSTTRRRPGHGPAARCVPGRAPHGRRPAARRAVSPARRTCSATVVRSPRQGAPWPGRSQLAPRPPRRSSDRSASAGSSVNGAGPEPGAAGEHVPGGEGVAGEDGVDHRDVDGDAARRVARARRRPGARPAAAARPRRPPRPPRPATGCAARPCGRRRRRSRPSAPGGPVPWAPTACRRRAHGRRRRRGRRPVRPARRGAARRSRRGRCRRG